MGRRRPPGRLGTRQAHPAGGGHHRPGHTAGESHLVPGHQPAPPRRATRGAGSRPAADLAEIVRLYGLRLWVEQGYKQAKDELGWADFQVRSDIAIRRHQALVNCAFCFCWHTWFDDQAPTDPPGPATTADPEERGTRRRCPAAADTQLAASTAHGAQLAHPRHRAHTLVASMVASAPTP